MIHVLGRPGGGGKHVDKPLFYCVSVEFEVGIVAIPSVLCVFLDFGSFLARSQIQKVLVLLTKKCYVLGPPRVPQRGVQGRLREAVFRLQKVAKALFLLCI